MTVTEPHSTSGELQAAVRGLRDHAVGANRPDLADRLDFWLGRLQRPQVRIVVIGPFKQGKSTLVNTLVGAPICPVDDIHMTAVPTFIEYGASPEATLVVEVPGESDSMSIPIDPADLRKHVTDHAVLLAGATISLIPLAVAFFLAQKYFIRGVATTGLK